MRTEEVNIRDPYMLIVDGVYYLYGTRSATCWGKADGFDCYRSVDGKEWGGPIEIFRRPEDEAVFQDTQACIIWLYQRMEYGCKRYPGFFSLHSLGFMGEDKSDGKRRMQQTWQHILDSLHSVLLRDTRVRPDAFTEAFTAEKFSDLLFSLMLSALLRQDYDPSVVLEIVRRTLY